MESKQLLLIYFFKELEKVTVILDYLESRDRTILKFNYFLIFMDHNCRMVAYTQLKFHYMGREDTGVCDE